MSVYSDMSEKAAKARKFNLEAELKKIYGEEYAKRIVQNKMDFGYSIDSTIDNILFSYHEITPEVQAQIDSMVISTEDVTYAIDDLDDIVRTDLRNYAQNLRMVKSDMTKDVLSLNNQSFEADLEEAARVIEGYCNKIISFEDAVRNRLPQLVQFQEDYQTDYYFNHGNFKTFNKGK